jgi:hypothetical protein
LRKKYYKVSNISGQRVELNIVTQDDQIVTDYLEEGEEVYGLNENAAKQLHFYEWMGLVKIEETEYAECPKVRWLKEGF